MATVKRSARRARRTTAVRPAPNAAFKSQEGALWTTPIILQRDKKKSRRGKRKKKYSKGTKGFQRLLQGVAESANRVSRGFARNTRTFADRSRRSSRKRRDGLMRDFFKNESRAIRKGSRQFTKAPEEITKRLSTRRTWKALRIWTPLTSR
ncbi:MAG TPA: hypothetical protein VGQ76_21160 [Thermoanaerobaculia bacterium]|nr:hypothetical protein [Thermoanaerobaculia bacterium]